MLWGLISKKGKNFSLLQNVQTSSGAYLALSLGVQQLWHEAGRSSTCMAEVNKWSYTSPHHMPSWCAGTTLPFLLCSHVIMVQSRKYNNICLCFNRNCGNYEFSCRYMTWLLKSNLATAVNAINIMYEQFSKCICIDSLIITDTSKYC
jgi:hypothetical protein